MTPEAFPVALKLTGLRVVVLGSGAEAVRRAGALHEAGAVVVVIAARPSPELRRFATESGIVLCEVAFDPSQLDGAWLAVSTDPDPGLEERVADAAEARQIFFCAVDGTKRSTFAHVAIARSAGLTLAVSTSGRVPALARRVREELARLLSEVPLVAFVERLVTLRRETPSAERRRVLEDALRGLEFSGRLVLPDLPPPGPPQDREGCESQDGLTELPRRAT